MGTRFDHGEQTAISLVRLHVVGPEAVADQAVGLVSPVDLAGHRETDFVYHPGWFSLITALVAGTAGMLSLTSSKAAALVEVFISVTTIVAAGRWPASWASGTSPGSRRHNWASTWSASSQPVR